MSFDWGSVFGAAVSLWGAKEQSDAAKDAGKQATQAQQSSDALQKYIYDDQRNLAMPGYNAGLKGLDQYMKMLGLGGMSNASGPGYSAPGGLTLDQAVAMQNGAPIANAQLYATDPAYKAAWDGVYQHHYNESGTTAFTNQTDANKIRQHVLQLYNQYKPTTSQPSQQAQTPQQLQQEAFAAFRAAPGYQFGLDEGNKQVQASAAARGGLNSGATLKALMEYGQNYADQQGYTPYMNKLASLWGGAQTATNQIGNAGQNYANQTSQNAWNGANARANSTYNSANAWANGLNNAAYFGGQAYDSWSKGR